MEAVVKGQYRLAECIQTGIKVEEIRRSKRESGTGYDDDVLPGQPSTSGHQSDVQERSSDNEELFSRKRKRQSKSLAEKQLEVSEELSSWISLHLPNGQSDLRMEPDCRRILGTFLFNSQHTNMIIQTAWESTQAKWINKSMEELILDRKKLLITNPKYYTPIYSFFIFMRVLLNNWVENQVVDFIGDIIDWFNKVNPKQNCLHITGKHSCGKTYITDPLLALAWNIGDMKNLDKFTSFPFEDCFYRRAILWNEAQVSPDKIDMCKAFLEGHNIKAERKYLPPGVITRTPVLITANKPLWMTCRPERDTLQSRMYIYTMDQQPWLKSCKKFLNPLLFEMVLEYFYASQKTQLLINNLIPEEELLTDAGEHKRILWLGEEINLDFLSITSSISRDIVETDTLEESNVEISNKYHYVYRY